MMTHASHREARSGGTGWLKLRALLAGGLVLGLGATATLASWNDTDYAAGSFETSTFVLESSPTTSPADFAPHPEDAPLVLEFAATGMVPGSVQHRAVFLRNTGNVAGTYTFAAPAMATDDPETPLQNYVGYRVVETTQTCTAARFNASATYLAGGPQSWASIGTEPSTPRALPAESQVVGLCIELRLDPTTPNNRQGQSAAVQFVTTATSASP